MATLLKALYEARRDALVEYYLAHKVPTALQDEITTPEDLYQYLLLDTKIDYDVKTTAVAEAINSVQLALNRAVNGLEGPLASASNQFFQKGRFLDIWEQYNKRYSTWAGKEKLKYYAAYYIEPSLRYNKTELFQNFEQAINAGRLTNETVVKALGSYIASFDKLRDLKYISVNRGKDENTLFFIGRTKAPPYEYYWRKLELKANSNGRLIPDQWSEWLKISIGPSVVQGDVIYTYWENYRWHIYWLSNEAVQNAQSEPITQTYRNDWVYNGNATWSCYSKEPYKGDSDRAAGDNGGTGFWEEINLELFYALYNGSVLVNTPQKILVSFAPTKANEFEEFTCGVSIGPDGYPKYEISSPTGELYLNGDKLPNAMAAFGTNGNLFYPLFRGSNLEFGLLTFTVNGYMRSTGVNYGTISNDGQYFPPSGSHIDGPIDLQLPSHVELVYLLSENLQRLYDYDVQAASMMGGIPVFYGPYGMYLWEIFFHIPFLAATRFVTEQRFLEAEQWYKYIFSSTGYRDSNGKLLTNKNGKTRFWNLIVLQEDVAWDDTISIATDDPDRIALADPMQYKLAIFIHTIQMLISRGDNLYRLLERDTLNEAKMYYIEAAGLLGPRPDVRFVYNWPNPSLASEALDIAVPTEINAKSVNPIESFQQLIRAKDGHFLPPYSEILLSLWDTLDIRLYNLRHNLTIDGQPLDLPLYAEPMDPKKIQQIHGSGNGLSDFNGSALGEPLIYRFPTAIEAARSSINNMVQFGSAMLNALERQDAETAASLLQIQQIEVTRQTTGIQSRNLSALQRSLEEMTAMRRGAVNRRDSYNNQINNWMTNAETQSLAMRTAASIVNGTSTVPVTIAGALDIAPNVFGLATGGSRWGSISSAIAQDLQIAAAVIESQSNVADITESYRRRREDWVIQRDVAANEIEQLDARIASTQAQIDMVNKQISLAELENAQAQAIFELQSTRFTNQDLYNWVVGRLSSLYYQLYDTSLSLCILSKNTLAKEIGSSKTANLLSIAAWNDLYQGLLAGESLAVELNRMDALWIENNSRGLEATKTVSLDNQIRDKNSGTNWPDMLAQVLEGRNVSAVNGVSIALQADIFRATLDLSAIGLENSYNQTNKQRNIKNISVTLPTLLGPYQDIEASLTLGSETIALSHGMNDSGLFVTDFDDVRYLPFEGMDATNGNLTLGVYRVGKDGRQQELLKNLNDVVFHIRYIIK